MTRTILSSLAIAAMLSVAAMNAAPAGQPSAGAEQSASSQEPMRVAQAPQVRKSKVVVGPDHSKVKAKHATKVSKVICEGGQVKTASTGAQGCACGLNVVQTLVKANHFRCDNRPQVRKSKVVVGPDHSNVKAKRASEVVKQEPAKQPGSTGRPAGQTSTGKPVSECRDTLTATRHAAATKGFGLATAVTAWEHGAEKMHGFHMRRWKHAQNKDSNCSRDPVLWKCTVSARPCSPS